MHALPFILIKLDPLGKGFQIRQSLIALGSGGISGVGLGWVVKNYFS